MVGTLLDIGQKQDMWGKRESGLFAPKRANFPIENLALYLPLWLSPCYTLRNGTGIATGAPITLVVPATNTITVSQAGTFLIDLPAGVTGTATAGTMALTGSPVALVGGLNTITTTGAVGNFTVAVAVILSKDPNAHVCTVVGATQLNTGRLFDATDDYATIPDAASLQITGDMCIAIWCYRLGIRDAGYEPFLITKRDAGGTNYQVYLGTNLKVNFTGSVGNTTGTTVIGTNTWNFIMANVASTVVTIDINGVADTISGGGTTTVTADDAPLDISRLYLDNLYGFYGRIGESWIWKQSWPAIVRQHIYNQTKWRYI